MTPVYIYVLADPRTLAIRYVGSTTNASRRKQQHHAPQAEILDTWVDELRKDGLEPIFAILKETTPEERYAQEGHWIAYFAMKGSLFNTNIPKALEADGEWIGVPRLSREHDIRVHMDEQSWRVRDIAQRLNIARETVLRLLHQGKLHGFKAGRDWRVKESELQRFEALRGEVRHPTAPDAFADLNHAITPGGLCTQAAVQDQLSRETSGREFISPVNPDEGIPDEEDPLQD